MRIWIDLDNSPHVLFFAPVIRDLERRGVEVTITLREFSQTRELAEQHGLQYRCIGRHYGSAKKSIKVAGTLYRAACLGKAMMQEHVDAAVSHGSRAMALAGYALGYPVMTLYDYEFASYRLFNLLSTRIVAPEVIPADRLVVQGLNPGKLMRYDGLKEEVYVYGYSPRPTILKEIGFNSTEVIVTVRPPAVWAHYHNRKSEDLFAALMQRLQCESDIQVAILARSEEQSSRLKRRYVLRKDKFHVFTRPVDGLSLMCWSDFVFSGGGTMSREAALLGLNVYSIFGGSRGAGEESLIKAHKLKAILEPADIDRITFRKVPQASFPVPDCKHLAHHIASTIFEFAKGACK